MNTEQMREHIAELEALRDGLMASADSQHHKILELERGLADVMVEIGGCGPGASKDFHREALDSAYKIASRTLRNKPSPPPSDGKTIKNLCDRIDRICSIAHDKTIDLSERIAQVQMWSEGFAPIPGQSQNNDAAIACKWIVDLFAWDMDGVTWPKPPYSWETVARIASDYAAGALKGNTSAVSDTARIDWLEKSDGRFFNIDKISATDRFNGHKFLRAAIDEAMRTAVEPPTVKESLTVPEPSEGLHPNCTDPCGVCDYEQRQDAINDAAEMLRMCYPHIPNSVYATIQAWFGSYQGLLTLEGSPVLEEQFSKPSGEPPKAQPRMIWDACSQGGLWRCDACKEAYCSPPWSREDAAKDHAAKCKGPEPGTTMIPKSVSGSSEPEPIHPHGHFWRGDTNRFICQHCLKHHDQHIHSDMASLCPRETSTANKEESK